MREKPIVTDEEEKTFDQKRLRIEDASFTARRALLKSRRNKMLFATALIFYITLAIFAYFINYFNWDKRLEDAIQSITVPGFRWLMIFLCLQQAAQSLKKFMNHFKERSKAGFIVLSYKKTVKTVFLKK